MSVTISYNGNDIATMSADGVKTLNTKDKYCRGNIIVSHSAPLIKDLVYKNCIPTGDIYIEADTDFPFCAVGGWIDANITSLTVDMKTYAFSGSCSFYANAIPKYHIIYNNSTMLPSYFIGKNTVSFIFVICGNSTTTPTSRVFQDFGNMTCIDFALPANLPTYAFYNDGNLKTIILRKTSGIVTMGGTSAMTDTPFKNGGSGGTIYIPKVLYDHLGDSTSLDYKAASNWSTIDSYGTITWAQIEGSQFENYYADGVPITTSNSIDYMLPVVSKTVNKVTLNITQLNHVKITLSGATSPVVINLTTGDIGGLEVVNNKSSLFEIPAEEECKLWLYNIKNAAASTFAVNFRLANSSTSASFGTGNDTHTGMLTVTKTLDTAENISCLFVYIVTAVDGTIEFDAAFGVGKDRYI